MDDDFFLTNLELRESDASGGQASGLSHASMKGMLLLSVLELAARGVPRGALTVLHDAGDWGDRYREFAMRMAHEGWAIALPDLRGHGRTEGTRGHSAGLQEVCRDVQEIQDHLAYRMPDSPKVLVGQGLGALYAATFALERPGMVSALVLLGPDAAPKFELPAVPAGWKKLIGKKAMPEDASQIGWRGDQLVASAEAASTWTQGEFAHGLITRRAIEGAQRAAQEYLPRIGAAGVPVLVLHGAEDGIAASEGSRALAGDNVTVELLAGQRHHPLQDSSAESTTKRIASWLDEVLPR
ncbi:MAG: alpha-beta hydrolase superfamily lysophospholipase [Planctomycetota bacterium]|jgi:alpha-beta hydrolase superfamily lysophospholipase